MYSRTQKFVKIFVLANIGRLKLHKQHSTKCEIVAKIKINRWPGYGVMITYNIMGIRLFRKSVAHCEKMPTYKGWPSAQVLVKYTTRISQNRRL